MGRWGTISLWQQADKVAVHDEQQAKMAVPITGWVYRFHRDRISFDFTDEQQRASSI